jgi:DNA-binding transcriptional ArsR family regulator
VHALDVLGDPVRRRILELLGDQRADGVLSLSAGDITAAIRDEFAISQPAVSQHLKVLRESGFTSCTANGQRRLYAIDDAPFREVDAWLDRYRRFWATRLDAFDTEIRRGKRARTPTKDIGERT